MEADRELEKCLLSTPVGTLLISATKKGVREIRYLRIEDNQSYHYQTDSALIKQACLQLTEYFNHQRQEFTFPLDLGHQPKFMAKVLEALRKVPYGHTSSYKAIAQAVNNPLSARAVGNALAANPVTIVLPCHRVIRSNGNLGGYSHQLDDNRKKFLLALEQS